MQTGLLWFDNDSQRKLEDKVLRAASHYATKYGHMPNVCFVHPSMMDGNGTRKVTRAGEVEIRAGRAILLNHFWLGVAEDNKTSRSQANA